MPNPPVNWNKACGPVSNDEINSPRHYTANGVECIDMIEEVIKSYVKPDEGYLVGSVWKYLYRAPHKGNKLKDLRKAAWFLNRLITKAEKAEDQEEILARFRAVDAPYYDCQSEG